MPQDGPAAPESGAEQIVQQRVDSGLEGPLDPAPLSGGGDHTPTMPPRRAQEHVTDLTPRFKMVFATVVGITVLSLLLNAILVFARIDDDASRTFIETCSTTFKLGFGAIVGLVGGKVV